MWLTGLVAPRHVGSSQTRARTRVPCIGRQILNHCATREAQFLDFFPQIPVRYILECYPLASLVFCFVLFFCFYNFIYFWLHWVFVAVRGLSLVAASRGYSSLRYVGFSLRWLLLLWSAGSRRMGLNSCGMRAQ